MVFICFTVSDSHSEKVAYFFFVWEGMDAIGFGNGFCGFWKWDPKPDTRRRRIRSNSGSPGSAVGGGYQFPLKQALTAASLTLTGDTIAQLSNRWNKAKESGENASQVSGNIVLSIFNDNGICNSVSISIRTLRIELKCVFFDF